MKNKQGKKLMAVNSPTGGLINHSDSDSEATPVPANDKKAKKHQKHHHEEGGSENSPVPPNEAGGEEGEAGGEDKEEDNSLIDYQQLFVKQPQDGILFSEGKDLLQLMRQIARRQQRQREEAQGQRRKSRTGTTIEEEEEKEEAKLEAKQFSSHQRQLKDSLYSSRYHSFKTSLIAFFYFFQIPTKTVKKMIDLLEGCDNRKNYRVDLKEFALRYCGESKLFLFLLYKYFEAILQQKTTTNNNNNTNINNNSSPSKQPQKDGGGGGGEGSKPSSPNARGNNNPLSRANSMKNSSTGGADLTAPYYAMVLFLTHFMSIKPNDYIIYFHWLLTYGSKQPLEKKGLEEIFTMLHKDRAVRDAAKPKTIFSGLKSAIGLGKASASSSSGSGSSKGYGMDNSSSNMSTNTRQKFASYLDELPDETLTSGQLRLVDSKMNSLITSSCHALRRRLIQSTYPDAYWKEISSKIQGIAAHHLIEDHYQKVIKEMSSEETDLCYDLQIIQEKKNCEKELRRGLRLWKSYIKMTLQEQQSLSDISGVEKTGQKSTFQRIYSLYCLPYILSWGQRINPSGGGSGGDSSLLNSQLRLKRMMKKPPNSKSAPRRQTVMAGLMNLMSWYYEGDYDDEGNKKEEKISFKTLTYKPPIPTMEELNILSLRTKKAAFDTIREAEELLNGIPSRTEEEQEEEDDDDAGEEERNDEEVRRESERRRRRLEILDAVVAEENNEKHEQEREQSDQREEVEEDPKKEVDPRIESLDEE